MREACVSSSDYTVFSWKMNIVLFGLKTPFQCLFVLFQVFCHREAEILVGVVHMR